jgi:hypothetical protein
MHSKSLKLYMNHHPIIPHTMEPHKDTLDTALLGVGLIESRTPRPNVYMGRCVYMGMQCSVGVYFAGGTYYIDILCVGSVVPSVEHKSVSVDLDTGEICNFIATTATRMWQDNSRMIYREFCEEHEPFGPMHGAKHLPPAGPMVGE